MTYGITPEGFNLKSATTIKAEIEAALKAGPLGASAGSEPDGSIPVRSLAGQLVSIVTDGLSALWQLAQAVYAALNPSEASAAGLDALCALTGTYRRGATESTATIYCTGTAGTALAIGRVVAVETSGTRFASTAAGTIATATAWVSTTAYAAGAVRTNASRIYYCTAAGTSAGSGGPTTTADAITDGTVTWRYVGEGTGYAAVAFEAEDSGPLAALSGTLTEIATPVSGWTSARNLSDAALGQDEETDAELRLRREIDLAGSGKATPNAIRADVLALDDVEECKVFVNDTDYTNSDGLPPHSIEVVVRGGDDDEIAAAIFDAVAGGIEVYATSGSVYYTTAIVEDSTGTDRTLSFMRADVKDIWVIVDVTYDAATAPSDLATQVRDAILLSAAEHTMGRDVWSTYIEGAVTHGPSVAGGAKIPGILGVTKCWIGLSNPPTGSTTIPIALRELAVFDSSRITVNTAAGTP